MLRDARHGTGEHVDRQALVVEGLIVDLLDGCSRRACHAQKPGPHAMLGRPLFWGKMKSSAGQRSRWSTARAAVATAVAEVDKRRVERWPDVVCVQNVTKVAFCRAVSTGSSSRARQYHTLQRSLLERSQSDTAPRVCHASVAAAAAAAAAADVTQLVPRGAQAASPRRGGQCDSSEHSTVRAPEPQGAVCRDAMTRHTHFAASGRRSSAAMRTLASLSLCGAARERKQGPHLWPVLSLPSSRVLVLVLWSDPGKRACSPFSLVADSRIASDACLVARSRLCLAACCKLCFRPAVSLRPIKTAAPRSRRRSFSLGSGRCRGGRA